MTRTHSIFCAAAFSLITFLGALHADLITLKDGRVINGRLYRDSDQYIIAPAKGQPFKVALNQVVGITLQTTASPARQATENWRYIQSQVNRSGNLAQIITLLQGFIIKYAESPKVPSARKYLAQFKHYQKAGFVHVGGQWMSPEQRDKLVALCAGQTAAAQKLLVAGKLAQAEAHVMAALQVDPENVNGLILRGIIAYQRNNIQTASHSFAAALHADPKNIVALNDQAVTLFRQRRQPAALLAYQKALHIDNGNRMLLDNVAAALQIYKKSQRSPLYRNLKSSFRIADRHMQARMARHGLYRFGAGWVDAKTAHILDKRLADYHSRKSALDSQYQVNLVALQSVNTQIANVNSQIDALINAINIMQINQGVIANQTGGYDLGNQAIVYSDVAALTQAQNQAMQLATQRVSILAGIKSLKIQAALLEKHAPRLALRPTQYMMLPMDQTNVPLPALLPATAITNAPRIIPQQPLPH